MTDDAPPDAPKPKRRGKAPPARPTPTSTGGRTALTPEIANAIARAVEGGSPLKYAALAAGITTACVHDWEARGAAGEEPFAEFVHILARARAKGIVAALQGVKDGTLVSGKSDWKALREWLATIAPEEFAPTSTIEVKVRGEAVAHVLRLLRGGLDPAAYNRCVDVLRSAGGGSGSDVEAGERRDH